MVLIDRRSAAPVDISNAIKYRCKNREKRATLGRIFINSVGSEMIAKLQKRKPELRDEADDRDPSDSKISYQGYVVFNTAAEKAATDRLAVEELYKVYTGKDASPKTDINDLLREVAAENGGQAVNLIIVRIDPNDVTASFVDAMEGVDRFLAPSKKRFIEDAMKHLGELDPERQSGEIKALGRALIEARKAGHLEGHEQALDTLLARTTLQNGNITDALASSFKNIDQVPEESKPKLLADALSHLEKLKDIPTDRATPYRLNIALGKARYDGHLARSEQIVAEQNGGHAGFQQALSNATTEFLANSIKNINKVARDSRHRLLSDALDHFAKLDADAQPNEMKMLGNVLAKAQYARALDDHTDTLANLCEASPDHRRALKTGRTTVFANAMKNIHELTEAGKQNLINDAFNHFKQLDPKSEKPEINRLSHTFVAAREDGLLNNRTHDLAALGAIPAFKNALEFAEKKHRESDTAQQNARSSAGSSPVILSQRNLNQRNREGARGSR